MVLLALDNPVLAGAIAGMMRDAHPLRDFEALTISPSEPAKLAAAGAEIIVLDPDQFDADCAELVAAFGNGHVQTRLVAYVAKPSLEGARQCLQAGFRAYLTMSAESTQILRALNVVAHGGVYVDRRYAAATVGRADSACENHDDEGLSERERAVLKRIALGMSHKQIALDLHISHKTVDTYRARAMRKLAIDDRGKLVRFAISKGWLE
ncbi:response regulator transcription factor [Roseibium salinum]|uniref:Response regulator transcription factor n=1 Tax=Roseibium salinum TaxID=1604349 RepID=A0ABT3QWP2_9HYPH|nr:response regulator transcription factor [Roseibium sp. DSM 29163]MCX2721336.1 response regulator transcription factor [Roseibium sp. DSM 29163]